MDEPRPKAEDCGAQVDQDGQEVECHAGSVAYAGENAKLLVRPSHRPPRLSLEPGHSEKRGAFRIDIAMKGESGERKGAVGTLQNQTPTP